MWVRWRREAGGQHVYKRGGDILRLRIERTRHRHWPSSTYSCPNDSASTCLSYDAQSRLVQVTKPGGLTMAMTYNAQGLRMSYAAKGGGDQPERELPLPGR